MLQFTRAIHLIIYQDSHQLKISVESFLIFLLLASDFIKIISSLFEKNVMMDIRQMTRITESRKKIKSRIISYLSHVKEVAAIQLNIV